MGSTRPGDQFQAFGSFLYSEEGQDKMSKSIEQAVVSGDFLEFYWQTRRHSPDKVRSILSVVDPATLTAFIIRLINEWYRLRTQLAAANEELDVYADD